MGGTLPTANCYDASGYAPSPAGAKEDVSLARTPRSGAEPEAEPTGSQKSGPLKLPDSAGFLLSSCYDTGHVKTPNPRPEGGLAEDVAFAASSGSTTVEEAAAQIQRRWQTRKTRKAAENVARAQGATRPPWLKPIYVKLTSFIGTLAAVTWVLGARSLFLGVSGGLAFLFIRRERLLAGLLCWGIKKVPNRTFVWTIDRILVRPSFSNAPNAWGEIVMVNWTWHNPPGFKTGEEGGDGWMLKIDRVTIRLRFGSIYSAVRYKRSIEVDLLFAEGLSFKTSRDQSGTLNLWSILELPDPDVNIKAFLKGAHSATHGAGDAAHKVAPLPAVSTTRTREAAKYWRPEWESSRSPSSREGPLPANLPPGYKEYPIGDPRRRPRWGVPLRLDIRHAIGLNVNLWLLDFITMDSHRRTDYEADTKVWVRSIDIPREDFESGDPRRAGSDDGIHGLYLGELIKVIIAEAIPYVVREAASPLFATGLNAAIYGSQDVGLLGGARAVEFVQETKEHWEKGVRSVFAGAKSHHGHEWECRLQVQLKQGRALTDRQGDRINVYAKMELRDPPSANGKSRVVDEAESRVQMWTKAPRWEQSFELGPVSDAQSTLRIGLYSCAALEAVFFKRQTEHFLGEIVVPLAEILLDDPTIGREEDRVGWFPLAGATAGACGCRAGELKLGLRLANAEWLTDTPLVASAEKEKTNFTATESKHVEGQLRQRHAPP